MPGFSPRDKKHRQARNNHHVHTPKMNEVKLPKPSPRACMITQHKQYLPPTKPLHLLPPVVAAKLRLVVHPKVSPHGEREPLVQRAHASRFAASPPEEGAAGRVGAHQSRLLRHRTSEITTSKTTPRGGGRNRRTHTRTSHEDEERIKPMQTAKNNEATCSAI